MYVRSGIRDDLLSDTDVTDTVHLMVLHITETTSQVDSLSTSHVSSGSLLKEMYIPTSQLLLLRILVVLYKQVIITYMLAILLFKSVLVYSRFVFQICSLYLQAQDGT